MWVFDGCAFEKIAHAVGAIVQALDPELALRILVFAPCPIFGRPQSVTRALEELWRTFGTRIRCLADEHSRPRTEVIPIDTVDMTAGSTEGMARLVVDVLREHASSLSAPALVIACVLLRSEAAVLMQHLRSCGWRHAGLHPELKSPQTVKVIEKRTQTT